MTTTDIAPELLARVKERVNALMGCWSGDGCTPREAAAVVNAEYGLDLTPHDAWRLWFDGLPD